MQTTTDSEQVVEDDVVKEIPDYSDSDMVGRDEMDNGREANEDEIGTPQQELVESKNGAQELISEESNTTAPEPVTFLTEQDTFAVERNGAASESDGEHPPYTKENSAAECRAEPHSAPHVFEEVVNSAIQEREHSETCTEQGGRLVPQPPVMEVSRRDSAVWRHYEGREMSWKMKMNALQKKVDEQQNDLTTQSQLISTLRKTQTKLTMTEEELNQTRLRCKQLNESLLALRKVNSVQSFDLDRQRQRENRQAEVIVKLKNAIDSQRVRLLKCKHAAELTSANLKGAEVRLHQEQKISLKWKQSTAKLQNQLERSRDSLRALEQSMKECTLKKGTNELKEENHLLKEMIRRRMRRSTVRRTRTH